MLLDPRLIQFQSAWFSIARKSLIVAAMCNEPRHPTGEPAK